MSEPELPSWAEDFKVRLEDLEAALSTLLEPEDGGLAAAVAESQRRAFGPRKPKYPK